MIYPKATPTQPEIIAIALSKLCLKQEDVFLDIGCGSASVAMKAAPFVKQVYAIDDREEAIQAASENLKEIPNAKVLMGEASELLNSIEADCAFLGGSRNLEKVLEIMMKKLSRFVISAIRIETASLALEILKSNHKLKELLQIHISRGKELAGGIMLKSENPVFLIVGGEEC